MSHPLKPCPFCGKPAQSAFVHASIPWWQVECTDCSAHVDAETEADAIAAWNTRASTASEAERVREALEPFAKCCEQIADDEPDDEWAKFRLTVGDYRRALAAIRSLPIGGR